MEERAAGAENPQHAIPLAEIVESHSLSQGSQNQNYSAGQNRELHQSKRDLYNAAVKGDWKKAEHLLRTNPDLARTDITERGETALHVATGARKVYFVRLLMACRPELLAQKDRNGNTPFSIAAAAGCTEIARIMLERNPNLMNIRGPQYLTPLNMAVLLGKRDMAMFLYNRLTSYLTPDHLKRLFFDSITNDLYDFALKLLDRKPELALTRQHDTNVSALHLLSRKPKVILDRKVKKCTRNQESTSCAALQLLDRIWNVAKVDPSIRSLITKPSNLLFDAARLGNSLFLSELIRWYPDLVYELDKERRTIFHVAILHRQLSVFDLINKIGFNKDMIATYVDHNGNSMLHLAAMLYRYPGSNEAVEMQQELEIFQVEKLMQPALREAKNGDGLTPHELFAREHAQLQQRGAEWMNNTANSSSLVATLIVTVGFAALFTVPGGTDDKTGTPLLLKKAMFHVFAISNGIALSFSSFAILMFLSILTSGYTQSQFLRSLPLKLMFGLSALSVSTICMIITFSSTYFLLYREGSYIPTLIAVFASLPILIFCCCNVLRYYV